MILRKGPWLCVMIAVLTLAAIPVGFLITLCGWHYVFPTSGAYAMELVPGSQPFEGFTLRLFVSAFVNAISCYLIIGALTAAVRRLLRKTKSP